MIDLFSQARLKEEVEKYFPRCPFCHGKSLSAQRDEWRGVDHAICLGCGATWHLYMSQVNDAMKWAELMEIGNRGGNYSFLLGARKKPDFWKALALDSQRGQIADNAHSEI